jgi:hypothetical protein
MDRSTAPVMKSMPATTVIPTPVVAAVVFGIAYA